MVSYFLFHLIFTVLSLARIITLFKMLHNLQRLRGKWVLQVEIRIRAVFFFKWHFLLNYEEGLTLKGRPRSTAFSFISNSFQYLQMYHPLSTEEVEVVIPAPMCYHIMEEDGK